MYLEKSTQNFAIPASKRLGTGYEKKIIANTQRKLILYCFFITIVIFWLTVLLEKYFFGE